MKNLYKKISNLLSSASERRMEKQDAVVHRNLHVFDIGFHALLVIIRGIMIVWMIIGSALIFEAIREIISSKRPLIVNDVRTNWLGTAGFIFLIFGIILFGLFWLWFALRLLKRGWSRQLERIERKT